MSHEGITFRQTVSVGRGPATFLEERNFVPFPIVLNKNLPGSLA